MPRRWHSTGSPTSTVDEEKLGSFMVHCNRVPAGRTTSRALAPAVQPTPVKPRVPNTTLHFIHPPRFVGHLQLRVLTRDPLQCCASNHNFFRGSIRYRAEFSGMPQIAEGIAVSNSPAKAHYPTCVRSRTLREVLRALRGFLCASALRFAYLTRIRHWRVNLQPWLPKLGIIPTLTLLPDAGLA